MPDGASNTLLYGEILGEIDRYILVDETEQQGTALFSWMSGGGGATVWGLAAGLQARAYQFSSSHPARVHFTFADGSVRSLRVAATATIGSTDWSVLQQLAGRADGGIADTSLLVE